MYNWLYLKNVGSLTIESLACYVEEVEAHI